MNEPRDRSGSKDKRQSEGAAQAASHQTADNPGEWEGAEDNAPPTDPTKSHGELTESRSDALPQVSQVGQSSGHASVGGNPEGARRPNGT